jgi:hypothetical protein
MSALIDQLRNMLLAHDITTDYSEDTLSSFIDEAKLLVGEDFVVSRPVEEFFPQFHDDSVLLSDYPVVVDSVEVTCDDVTVTPTHVTVEGVVYFPEKQCGRLLVQYTVGLGTEDMEKYILPITVHLIMEKEGKNISSISEGDISVSYDTNNTLNAQVTTLIQELKNKYSGRVCLL